MRPAAGDGSFQAPDQFDATPRVAEHWWLASSSTAATRIAGRYVGASTGRIGTAVMQSSLRSVLAFCDSPQLNVPEAYVHFSREVFAEDGEVRDEETRAFPTGYMEEFREFIIRVLTVVPQHKP